MAPTDASVRDVTLTSAEGAGVSLGEYVESGQNVLVQYLRYYGCLPCLDELAQLTARKDRLATLGVTLVAVAPAAAHQAARLDARAPDVPHLLDGDGALASRLGIGRLTWRQLAGPRSIRNYVRAIARGERQGAVTGPVRQQAGIFVLDPSGRPLYRHLATALGDYPNVEDILSRAGIA